MYEYSDTYGFDLVVVFLVAVVMPIGVVLMQSRRAGKRAGALALMIVSVCYIAVFEHYRLHRPEITRAGVRRTFFAADGFGANVVVDDGGERVKFGVVELSTSAGDDDDVDDKEDDDKEDEAILET
jgi:hypothetical protein